MDKHDWDSCRVNCELCGYQTSSRTLYTQHWNRTWVQDSAYYAERNLGLPQIIRKALGNVNKDEYTVCPFLPWLIQGGNTEATREEIMKLIREGVMDVLQKIDGPPREILLENTLHYTSGRWTWVVKSLREKTKLLLKEGGELRSDVFELTETHHKAQLAIIVTRAFRVTYVSNHLITMIDEHTPNPHLNRASIGLTLMNGTISKQCEIMSRTEGEIAHGPWRNLPLDVALRNAMNPNELITIFEEGQPRHTSDPNKEFTSMALIVGWISRESGGVEHAPEWVMPLHLMRKNRAQQTFHSPSFELEQRAFKISVTIKNVEINGTSIDFALMANDAQEPFSGAIKIVTFNSNPTRNVTTWAGIIQRTRGPKVIVYERSMWIPQPTIDNKPEKYGVMRMGVSLNLARCSTL